MLDEGVPLQPGDVVAGRYRIVALLGQGGFGVVYRAVQLDGGREVALKMLLAAALEQDDGLARFQREAQLAQRLQHPNTVRLYDFGQVEGGLPFIAWEMLRGRPLDEVLRTERGLPHARVARIAAYVLKGLTAAHGIGIVHRDVKPSNLFLCDLTGEPDFVKVLDFGIAKSAWAGPALTRAGVILGTPSYMAPEQVARGEVTPATDLYALGLVMAEALAGRPVFTGDSALALCMAQLSEAPVPLPAVVLSSPLAAVITRATRKDAAARYASAAEMLAQIEASGPTLAAPAGRSFASAPTELGTAMPPPALSLASAPTELGTAMPSAPQVRSAAVPTRTFMDQPATFAALPAPPLARSGPPRSSGRRSLLLGGVTLTLALAGTLAAFVVWKKEHPGELRAGKLSSGAGTGSLVGRRFAQLTTAQLRARIEEAGYRVGSESSTTVTTFWLLEPAPYGEGNSVLLFHFQDPALAEATVRIRKNQPGAVARDGNSVLSVKQPQQAAAEALLQRLIR
jgi:hypothetical protein